MKPVEGSGAGVTWSEAGAARGVVGWTFGGWIAPRWVGVGEAQWCGGAGTIPRGWSVFQVSTDCVAVGSCWAAAVVATGLVAEAGFGVRAAGGVTGGR